MSEDFTKSFFSSSSDEPLSNAVPSILEGFDLEALRLSQDFVSEAGVVPLLTLIPVRRPSKEWFVRVHPDPQYEFVTYVLELKEEQEIYLVRTDLWPHLKGVEATFGPRLLALAANRHGAPFLWPARLSGPDGRLDNWGRTMLDAIHHAKDKWVRITPNKSRGSYDIVAATVQTDPPKWPDLSPAELIQIAFRDRWITNLDHPVLKRLRGEV